MKLIWLKVIWSMITEPACFKQGGNLSSMNCGKCKRFHTCAGFGDFRNMVPQVFWRWAKPGEAYKVSKIKIFLLPGVQIISGAKTENI